jgi:hypothetical protein
MTRTRLHVRITNGLLAATLGVGMIGAVAVPAGALGSRDAGACRPSAAVKSAVHAAARRREATLARLVGALQVRKDPWTLNGGQISALQAASSGISALDAQLQATCYVTVAAFRADATKLLTDYRVYWLRVPQTHGIEAADRLAEARTRLGVVATKLGPHVAGNAKAQTDLATMNQALAAADAKLGTPPSAAPSIAQLATLTPAADMTANDAAMETARGDLLAVRGSLVQARAAGLAVIADLSA